VSQIGLFVGAAVFGVGCWLGSRPAEWWAMSLRASGLLLVVGVLAIQVGQRGWLTDFDHAVTEWFAPHRNPTVDHLAVVVTNVFGPVGLAGMTIIVAIAVGWRFRSFICALTVIVTVGCVSMICTMLKLLVVRSRPPVTGQQSFETDYSFPSGHVTGTVALFGIAALAIGLGQSRFAKYVLIVVGLGIASAVALSLLYLGAHWVTDVVAGALLAGAAVTVGATVLRALIEDVAPPTSQLAHARCVSEDLMWTA
jgi:membrane-associated phospholipid phosphatase